MKKFIGILGILPKLLGTLLFVGLLLGVGPVFAASSAAATSAPVATFAAGTPILLAKATAKSHFPAKRKATGNRVFIFDPRRLMWGAYDTKGNLLRTGRASGGSHYCRDVGRACRTPRGEFKVYSKGGPGCRSSRYPRGRGGAPMPYCMFFHGNYAIHGSPNVPNHNASHGCIRVKPDAAKWLSKDFIQHGTTVIVKPY